MTEKSLKTLFQERGAASARLITREVALSRAHELLETARADYRDANYSFCAAEAALADAIALKKS
jgi:hypothetical protein